MHGDGKKLQRMNDRMSRGTTKKVCKTSHRQNKKDREHSNREDNMARSPKPYPEHYLEQQIPLLEDSIA
jgi:hypothetical protein